MHADCVPIARRAALAAPGRPYSAPNRSNVRARLPVEIACRRGEAGSALPLPLPTHCRRGICYLMGVVADEYDLVIVGGGLAGLTAGLFGARAGLRTLIVEQMAPGGQV